MSWASDGSELHDGKAFLFHLAGGQSVAKYPYKNDGNYASYMEPAYGPTFGGDLHICNACNGAGSYSNFNYSFMGPAEMRTGSPAAQAALAGARLFTVSEIEVFVRA